MIEVNLIEKKKVSKLPVVLGVDLNNLNFKMLVLAFIVYYAPDFYLTDQWQQEKAACKHLMAKQLGHWQS